MADLYVSGSIYDPAARLAVWDARERGHHIVHDWTTYDGPKRGPRAAAEAAAQFRAIVEDAEYVIVLLHPKLKAGWMEMGAALASPGTKVIVVGHPEVGDSLWFEHPRVTEVPDLCEALKAVNRWG